MDTHAISVYMCIPSWEIDLSRFEGWHSISNRDIRNYLSNFCDVCYRVLRFCYIDLLQSNLMEYWHSYQIWCAEQLFHKKLIIKIICNSNISFFSFVWLSRKYCWCLTYWLQQGDPDLLHYDVTQCVEQLCLWNHIKIEIVVHIKRIHYWFWKLVSFPWSVQCQKTNHCMDLI